MSPHRPRRLMAMSLTAVAALALGVSSQALADRAPNKPERTSLRAYAMKQCKASGQSGCRVAKIRVSTANARFAYVGAGGEWHDLSLVVRRPNARSAKWRVVATIGGGAPMCRDFRKVPRAVRIDLKLRGMYPDQSYGLCR